MNPLIAIESASFTPSSLTTLEGCSNESVYAPGYIQPHGLLLLLQEPHLKILQVSENVEQFFGISPAALLGQSLQKLLPRTQVKRITEFLLQDNLDYNNPFELRIRRKDPHPHLISQQERKADIDGFPLSCGERTQIFRSTLHRTKDALILELEPQLATRKNHTIQFYGRLQNAIISLRNSSLSDLAQTLAREVKALTDFDRVMVYCFEADEHGVVIAEAKESYLKSYLGLHYPASDIPAAARRLFLRNWVRQIPSVNYTPARLISINDTPNAAILIMKI